MAQKTKRVLIHDATLIARVSRDRLDQIEAFATANGLPDRSAAVRVLLNAGLRALAPRINIERTAP